MSTPTVVASRRSTAAWAAVDVALCTLAMAVALLSFSPMYSTAAWMLPVGAALVLGTGFGVLSARMRWSVGIATLLAAAIFVPVAVYLLVADRTSSWLPGVEALTGAADSVVGGFKRILTVVPPVEPDGQLIALISDQLAPPQGILRDSRRFLIRSR